MLWHWQSQGNCSHTTLTSSVYRCNVTQDNSTHYQAALNLLATLPLSMHVHLSGCTCVAIFNVATMLQPKASVLGFFILLQSTCPAHGHLFLSCQLANSSTVLLAICFCPPDCLLLMLPCAAVYALCSETCLLTSAGIEGAKMVTLIVWCSNFNFFNRKTSFILQKTDKADPFQ